MKLGEKQEFFMRLLPRLIDKAHELGFEIRGGDLFRDPRVHGQINVKQGYGAKNSCHKLKLAIDLNLFKDGAFIQTTEGHRELGEWWEQQHELCRWGFFILQCSISRYWTSALPSTLALNNLVERPLGLYLVHEHRARVASLMLPDGGYKIFYLV